MMARGTLTREIVLDVAEKAINKEGYENLNIHRLAKLLSIKPPSLYNHVAGLQDIRDALALRALRGLGDALAESMVGVSGADAIKALCDTYLDYAQNNPGLYELSQTARQWQQAEIQTEAESLVSLTKKALAPYQLCEEEQVHVIRTIRSLLHGFASLRATGFAQTIPVNDSIDYGITLFINSLPTAPLKVPAD